MYNYQLKESEKQSAIGYINKCNDKYCMIALTDVCRIFDNNQHCISCLDDDACATMTMANGTYYMVDPHSHDVKGCQNDKGASVLLYFDAKERLLVYLHMLAVQLVAIQFEVMPYKIQNRLTIQ